MLCCGGVSFDSISVNVFIATYLFIKEFIFFRELTCFLFYYNGIFIPYQKCVSGSIVTVSNNRSRCQLSARSIITASDATVTQDWLLIMRSQC